jgi:hypothetical protein
MRLESALRTDLNPSAPPGWLLLLASLLALAGCGQPASHKISAGTWTNSVYENSDLGFAIAIPETWIVQGPITNKRARARARDLITGDDKDFRADFKAAEKRTVDLFSAFKHPIGTSHNPTIVAAAERVDDVPDIRRGLNYLQHVKETLEASQLQVSFPREPYVTQLAGVDFGVLDVEMTIGGVTVKQRYFTTLRKGYALSFITSYFEAEDEALERTLLEAVKFR